ncbi:gephyrin-like isoform X2 [Linepithema humile]|uniref:gephyrin-like isoform X2 n=1 Tax=Linepithema humile TaxID=83485 RepID=UPI0006237007|nr:PREDICTED: gephyrin-like isoform X2 [Linepithema humile]
MDPIRISVLIVCWEKSSDEVTIWREELQKIFDTLPTPLQQIDVSDTLCEQNPDELEEQIIAIADSNTADIILILDLASKQSVITEIIDKIADREDTIGKVFAEIPTFLKAKIKSLKFGCRNNKLIFLKTAKKSGIFKIIGAIADTIVLAAHLLRTVVRNIVTRPERPFVHVHRPEVGEDKILCTQHSRSSSEIEISELSTSFNSSTDKNISTNQKTCQSKVSIKEALEEINYSVSEVYSLEDENISTNENTCESEVSVNEALDCINCLVSEGVIIPEDNSVFIKDAFGSILSDTIDCKSNVPPFLVSTKQGYAINAGKDVTEIKMETDESSKIGLFVLDPETTAFVEKGACIPFGANTVIPIEHVNHFGDAEMPIITTSHTVKYGENTKSPGSDIKENDKIIKGCTRIGPAEINLLSACGHSDVKVSEKLSIGVLTIGNNLQDPGQSLHPEASYDNNRAILISLLKENCFNLFNCSNFGIISKNTELITRKITNALEDVDLLVTTGCSSDKDCLKTILKDHFEAAFNFENVNMKPGKSTALASCNFKNKGKIILCLPKNPASVFLTAYLFLLPLVDQIFFLNKKYPEMVVKLEQKLLLHRRPRYVWATLSWREKGIKPTVKVTCKEENSISNKLSDIDGANALLVLPAKTPEKSTLEASSFVKAILIKMPNLVS